MYLKSLTISNFRGFREAQLNDIPELLIVIGGNDSGKSTLLEALGWMFSQPIFSTGSPSFGSVEGKEHLWFCANPEVPITFSAVIGLVDKDRQHLQKRMALPGFAAEGDLFISRRFLNKERGVYLICEKIEVKGLPPMCRIETDAESLEFKTEDGESRPDIEVSGKSISAVFVAQHLEILFNERFKLIPAVRERALEERDVGQRGLLLPAKTEIAIKRMGETITPAKQKEWHGYRDPRAGVVGEFDVKAGQIIFEKNISQEKIPIPINLVGGGHQMYLHLLHEAEDAAADIIAIEEPENHFHPKLIKQLMKDLERLTEQGKQFLITTHSPFVIDSSSLSNIWFAWQEEGESKIERITDKKEYVEHLFQIGVMPSDFLLSNAIVFVDGKTDRDFLTEAARKLDKDFEKAWVKIIPVGGDSKRGPHYELWAEIAEHVPLPKFALLDKDAEWVRKELIQKGMKDENMHTLQKGAIEDYYPRNLICQFVQDMSGKEIKENDIPVGQTVKILRGLFPNHKRRDRGWWKRPLAEKVSQEIHADQIDEEISSFIQQIFQGI